MHPEHSGIEVVSATRYSAEDFWQKSALGISLRRLGNQTIKASIAFQNTLGLPAVYNKAIQTSSPCDDLVFIHDDVWIDDIFFVDRVHEALGHFDLVGVAGNTRRVERQPAWYFIDIADNRFVPDSANHLSGRIAHGKQPFGAISPFGPVPQACELVDGVFLAARRSVMQKHQIYFDEQFTFHFYDMDICRTFREKQLQIGTWAISLTHQSHGAFGTPEWQHAYKTYLTKWE